jgi:hypothetical protein
MKIQLILGTGAPSTSRARMRAVTAECAIKAVINQSLVNILPTYQLW